MFRFSSIRLLPLMVIAPLFIYSVAYALVIVIMLSIPIGIFYVAHGRRRRW